MNEEQRKLNSERQIGLQAGGKNPAARRIVSDTLGIEFECIKDCAILLNVSITGLSCMLNQTRPMPFLFKRLKLHYKGKPLPDYNINIDQKDYIYCNGIFFNGLKKCSRFLNIDKGTLKNFLKGKKSIKYKFEEMNLRYATQEEIDLFNEIEFIKILNKAEKLKGDISNGN